jgi:hypothetical protein
VAQATASQRGVSTATLTSPTPAGSRARTGATPSAGVASRGTGAAGTTPGGAGFRPTLFANAKGGDDEAAAYLAKLKGGSSYLPPSMGGAGGRAGAAPASASRAAALMARAQGGTPGVRRSPSPSRR